MNILYIEDEPNDARLVERYINATPHHLVVATNLQDAQQALSSAPDLILVDVIIGQSRQGFSFVQYLRKGGFTQPVVAVTGLSLPDDLERCYEVGCNEVITKPYMINALAAVVNKYAS